MSSCTDGFREMCPVGAAEIYALRYGRRWDVKGAELALAQSRAIIGQCHESCRQSDIENKAQHNYEDR